MDAPIARASVLEKVHRVKCSRHTVGVVLAGCVLAPLLVGTSAQPAVSAATPLSVAQLEFPLPLVAHGDRVANGQSPVEVGYDTRRIPSATGSLYVRNDLQAGYTRVPLARRKATQQWFTSDGYRVLRATVPDRLLRGQRLFYYAVISDPASGRSVRVPAGTPESVWVINGASIVRLGVHRFDHVRGPDAVVARATPDEVGFEIPPEGGPGEGPWSFEVLRNGSVWLMDELNKRLLVWRRFHPNAVPRVVPLAQSFFPIDFALGPEHTVYVTRGPDPDDPPLYPGGFPPIHLDRLSATGQVLWESKLATDVFNTQLRFGPHRTLYWTGPFPSPRIERSSGYRWTPGATLAGGPLSMPDQDRMTAWGVQPLEGGLQLVGVTTGFTTDPVYGIAPHELRFALIDRSGRLVRAWRVRSRTVIWPRTQATPGLVGRDLVVAPEVTTGSGDTFKIEYVVLRLAATSAGTRARFSLAAPSLNAPPSAAWGDVITDVRIGPDGNVYQLGSSPTTGVVIHRYSLAPG